MRYHNLRYSDRLHRTHYEVVHAGRVVATIKRLRQPESFSHGTYHWVGEWWGRHLYFKRRGDIEAWLRKDGLL